LNKERIDLLDPIQRALLLIPYVLFFFFVLPLIFRDAAKEEHARADFGQDRYPIWTRREKQASIHDDLLKELAEWDLGFNAEITVLLIFGQMPLSVDVFLLQGVSIVILLLSFLGYRADRLEAKGLTLFVSISLFSGNAGYVLLYGYPFSQPCVGFFIFFLGGLLIPKILFSLL